VTLDCVGIHSYSVYYLRKHLSFLLGGGLERGLKGAERGLLSTQHREAESNFQSARVPIRGDVCVSSSSHSR
jgi:hypothetical protein